MGITLNDIAAQRAMLARGEEKRKADWKQAERERLRDTFAAAALTGLIANGDYSVESTPLLAWRMADVMLRERHKQPAPPCVETDGFSSSSRSGQINRSPERQSPDRECGESQLRDVPQLDNSRAAGGPEPCTPHPHATPTQGSVKGEGSVPRSQDENEPVAWAVETGGELEASFCGPAGREDAADWREQSDGVIVPLYRHPAEPCPHVTGKTTRYCTLTPFTLTDEERSAIAEIIATPPHEHTDCDDSWYGCPLSDGGCTNPSYEDGECNCGASEHNERMNAIAATLRSLLERLG